MDEKEVQYRMSLELIVNSARTIILADIPKMLNDINRAETVGPMLDPTLWMKKHKDMERDKEMLEAALPLWRWAKEMAEEAAIRRGGEGK